MNRPDLVVEITHRYLASILVIAVSAMVVAAWRRRGVPGVSGRRGAMRSALGALVSVLAAAILGGVTVKLGNAPYATVAHWLVAMALLAFVATTAMRAGALGGSSAAVHRGSARAARTATAAAALAIVAVAMGGLTAKYPGAAVGCTTIPWCGRNPDVATAAAHIQLTHRAIAVLLLLHLTGALVMLRRRRRDEAPVVIRASVVALTLVVLQLGGAAAMILGNLPPVLRSLHEAVGVGIWLACFVFAYLARRAARASTNEAVVHRPAPLVGSPSSVVPT